VFSRTLAACACAVAFTLSSSAQIEDSGLLQVDPWGTGFLAAGEPALPVTMWRASDSASLLPLMQAAPIEGLTPTGRKLMRRMALSPAAAPQGDDTAPLLAERARIIFALGEPAAAAGLIARLDTAPEGMDAAEITADLNLAIGNEAEACADPPGRPKDGAYWARLRAVCAALRDNGAGAELAIEMAAGQGVKDGWLTSAIFAASGELPKPPPARYDSGLAIAISVKAGLAPPDSPLSATRPDLAAALVTRPGIPASVRNAAAAIAAEAGLVDTAAWRKALDRALADPDFTPESRVEVALATARNIGMPQDGRADALADALNAAAVSPARFAAVSRVLAEDLARLSLTRETAPHALLFARASIAAGDFEGAELWTLVPDIDGAPDIKPFDFAMIDALAVLAGNGDPDAAATRLIETATAKGDGKAAARLFALWTVAGIAPPPAARALMAAESETPGKTGKPGALLAMLAAADAGAAGETILAAVTLIGSDPSGRDAADLALVGAALRRINAPEAAASLALEASGYWKPAK
jgi:hypothetical protein